MVFAAASLRDWAVEIGEAIETVHGIEPTFNFAGSNVLARQIEAATGADIFLSADREWVETLERAGRTVASSRRDLFRNQMVVIGHRDTTLGLDTLADLAALPYRHLALAEPVAVPAGRYARAHLEATPVGGSDLWRAVADRVAPTLDVRAALALVAADPEIVGIVYRTDAASSDRVRTLHEIAPSPEVDIVYCATLVEGGQVENGRIFLDALRTPEARAITRRHGFVPIDE